MAGGQLVQQVCRSCSRVCLRKGCCTGWQVTAIRPAPPTACHPLSTMQHWRWKLQRHLRRSPPQRGGPQQRALALPQQQQLGGGEAEEGGLSELQQQLLQAQWAEQQQQGGGVMQPPQQLELEQGRLPGSGAAAGV